MNKKVFLIPIAIGLVVFFLFELIHKDSTGSKFEMTVPETEQPAKDSVKAVTLFLDNSGSMKGYVDFRGLPNSTNAQATMISTLSNILDNVYSSFSIEPTCYCGGTTYNRNGFLVGMRNQSIFHGAITELHNLIRSVSAKTGKDSVSIIASDMILSYGRTKLLAQKDTFYNRNQLEQLGAEVFHAMTECKNKGLDVMMLQYYSDYNGNYYCNYTENLRPNVFKGKNMSERPYYLLVIGSKDNLKNLMVNHCFNDPAHVYASFKMDPPKKQQAYTVENGQGSKVLWQIGDPKNADMPGSVFSDSNFGGERSTLIFTCDRIPVPGYISLNDEHKLVPDFDKDFVESVQETSGTDGRQMFTVTLKPYNTLKSKSDVSVRLNSDVSWPQNASTKDDTKDDINKQTWGFSTVMDNISKAFGNNEPQTIAEFKFNIIIK